MKITVWDRIWSALSGVLIVLAGLWLLGLVFVVQPTWLEVVWMSAPLTWWQRAVMIVGALALIALGLHDVLLLFRRTREKGFIIQHSEYGDMSISMNALESMVQKCVASHQELTVNATHIQHAREGIVEGGPLNSVTRQSLADRMEHPAKPQITPRKSGNQIY